MNILKQLKTKQKLTHMDYSRKFYKCQKLNLLVKMKKISWIENIYPHFEKVNSATTGLLIKVQDIEDKPPEFVSVPSVTRIAEDVPTFTEVSDRWNTYYSFFPFVNQIQFWSFYLPNIKTRIDWKYKTWEGFLFALMRRNNVYK